MISITVLSIKGCQDTPPTIELVKKVASQLGLPYEFSHIEVQSTEQAQELKFPGSPTVRVDGFDIQPEMRNTTHFGMT